MMSSSTAQIILASKFLINDARVKFGKPLVYGSILGFRRRYRVLGRTGRVIVAFIPNHPAATSLTAPKQWCRRYGRIAGTVQALEAIKMALGLEWCKEKHPEPLLGTLWILDARSMQTKTLKLHKRHQCARRSCDPNDIVLEQAEESCTAKTDVKNISAEDAAKRMGKAVFIDVREAHELASGRIPKALHIPLGTLLSNEDSVGDIAPDTQVIVYCQHGIRSFSAASHLVTFGFKNVAHITGGIVRWKGELA
ncbi:MAG: rhodanese-like domain-containing protein [Rickettsiales bacterium]